MVEQDLDIELGRAIWRLALAGMAREAIAEQLGISIELLDQTLFAFRKHLHFWSDEEQRALDVDRIEALIGEFFPIALDVDADFDLALRASRVVLELMETELALLEP